MRTKMSLLMSFHWMMWDESHSKQPHFHLRERMNYSPTENRFVLMALASKWPRIYYGPSLFHMPSYIKIDNGAKRTGFFIEEFQHIWTEGWRSIQKYQKEGRSIIPTVQPVWYFISLSVSHLILYYHTMSEQDLLFRQKSEIFKRYVVKLKKSC